MPQPPTSYVHRFSELNGFIGSAFNRYLATHGRWMIYVRADRRFPCPSYDVGTGGEGNAPCPNCFDIGFKVRVERMKGVFSYPSTSLPDPGGFPTNYGGITAAYPAFLYTRSETYPTLLDLVFEVEWDVPYGAVDVCGIPTQLITAWRIKLATPINTGSEGRPNMHVSTLEQHEQQSQFFENTLRAIGPSLVSSSQVNEGMLPGQNRPSRTTPGGGESGSRYNQADSPNDVKGYSDRLLGRASRKPRIGF